jgi:hypothetical protein
LGLEADAEKGRFVREILPGLSAIPVRRIARQAGISLRHASLVRDGLAVPHPLHKDALAWLVGCREGAGA